MTFEYPVVESITPGMSGFYRISHEAYHDGPGISSTKIKKALISHAVYTQEDSFDSAALAFGRAFHAALLEPEYFDKQYVVSPDIPGHKNSTAYKVAFSEWLDSVTGKEIISGEDFATIAAMIKAVTEHDEYAELPKFQAEIMAVTTCPVTGLQIKCKADLFHNAIYDFKSTSGGLSPAEINNDMVKWRYHVSAAFYQDIVYRLIGQRLPFWIVPVTKKGAIECEFYRLSDELLEEGRKLYKIGLRRIKEWAGGKIEPKKARVLYPNSRLLYSSKDIIDFIEGT